MPKIIPPCPRKVGEHLNGHLITGLTKTDIDLVCKHCSNPFRVKWHKCRRKMPTSCGCESKQTHNRIMGAVFRRTRYATARVPTKLLRAKDEE